MTDLASISGRLATFIRLLGSDKDGEVVAAAHAMVRTLNNFGLDIHDIAARVLCYQHRDQLNEPGIYLRIAGRI